MNTANLQSEDYYEILGVPRHATKEQIIEAYRRLAAEYQPPATSTAKAGSNQANDVCWTRISEAFNVLSCTKAREIYDTRGKEALDDPIRVKAKEKKLARRQFFAFGKPMDPMAPKKSRGVKRALVGLVYAPAKGFVYGGKHLMLGLLFGVGSVMVGLAFIGYCVGGGITEMRKAVVNAFRKRQSPRERRATEVADNATMWTDSNSSSDRDHLANNTKPRAFSDPEYVPSFKRGLRNATCNALTNHIAWSCTGGRLFVENSIKAGGFVAHGFVGAIDNVKSGIHEVRVATRLEREQRMKGHERHGFHGTNEETIECKID